MDNINTFASYGRIPVHMLARLKSYINDGIVPEDFLYAVLSNNLSEAVARADSNNIDALPDYVRLLYNHAPSACWGSPQKVSDWIELKTNQFVQSLKEPADEDAE